MLGRRQWKHASGYLGQACTENAYYGHKSIIDDGLRARSRVDETSRRAFRAMSLNRMAELGRPESFAINR